MDENAPSELRLRQVRGVTRVVTCRNAQPLKMLQPQTGRGTARVVLSSYGGGMVQGDRVRLNVHGETDTRLHLATQANSRVYRNTSGARTTQMIDGHLERGARAVMHADPLVPHRDSELESEQEWRLDEDAELILMDWLMSGRSDSGESFAFRSYISRMRVWLGGEQVLHDNLIIKPDTLNPRSSARFGYSAEGFLTIFFIGHASQALARVLDPLTEPNEVHRIDPLDKYPHYHRAASARSLAHMEDRPVSVLRSIGRTREDFDDLVETLFGALAADDWLGFNPLENVR